MEKRTENQRRKIRRLRTSRFFFNEVSDCFLQVEISRRKFSEDVIWIVLASNLAQACKILLSIRREHILSLSRIVLINERMVEAAFFGECYRAFDDFFGSLMNDSIVFLVCPRHGGFKY